jgi:hypothetical protein
VAYGKRWTRLLSGAALALAAALAVQGCTSAPATSPASGSQVSSPAPAVTPAEASQAFASYRAAMALAASADGETSYLARLTGVAHATYSTAIQVMSRQHAHPVPGADYRYGTPTFYLPAPAGYPQWYVADVSITYTGSKHPALTPLDGSAVTWLIPDHGRELFLFEKASATAPWQLASSSTLAPGVSLPALARDGSGRVPVVPLSDTTLLARPDVTGPLQAAVVEDGPASPATKVVASGPLTTGLYTTMRTTLLGLSVPPGDVRQWELEGSPYQRLALRTADGGALVFYAMYLNTWVEVPAVLNKSEPVKPGAPITIPPYLTPLLPPGKPAPRIELQSQDLFSFAALDPPPGGGKIQVIGIGGGQSYAFAS